MCYSEYMYYRQSIAKLSSQFALSANYALQVPGSSIHGTSNENARIPLLLKYLCFKWLGGEGWTGGSSVGPGARNLSDERVEQQLVHSQKNDVTPGDETAGGTQRQ